MPNKTQDILISAKTLIPEPTAKTTYAHLTSYKIENDVVQKIKTKKTIGHIKAMTTDRHGDYLVVGAGKQIQFINLSKNRIEATITGPNDIYRLQLSHCNKYIAGAICAERNENIIIWKNPTFQPPQDQKAIWVPEDDHERAQFLQENLSDFQSFTITLGNNTDIKIFKALV